ncbi:MULTISPECIES: sugar transferase [unclassified Virgibacillus]|uniref:sugar transferase n=1 Tax=unclassified Virgibacillus TaxID=2620237 RepID=UPI0024DE39DD|nr:sugar transferase [Virgibacillus sp. LDC-1]
MGFMQTVSERSGAANTTYVYRLCKRIVDIAGSIMLLFLCSPLLLIIAYRLSKQEGSPIFQRELRTGRDFAPFVMYSFRITTIPSKVIRALPPHPFPSNWEHGVPNDFTFIPHQALYTPIGLQLKKYKLNKLPQLINVLKGDMSLIGPSPEYPEVTAHYNNEQQQRLFVKPGFTGYTQVNGFSNQQHDAKIVHDLYYVEHCSLTFDFTIMYESIRRLFQRKKRR